VRGKVEVDNDIEEERHMDMIGVGITVLIFAGLIGLVFPKSGLLPTVMVFGVALALSGLVGSILLTLLSLL
jgi:VIT1/CCC1 family predicted Fe2+/Mn2+ transporter